MKKLLIIVAFAVLLTATLNAQMPSSREAKVAERSNTPQIKVEATGIYISQAGSRQERQADIERNGTARAIEDAMRCAVYWLMTAGPSPLLRTAQEKSRLEANADAFFNIDNVRQMIIWQDNRVIGRKLINNGEGVTLKRVMTVDRDRVMAFYNALPGASTPAPPSTATSTPTPTGIVTPTSPTFNITQIMQIMVIPEVGMGVNPIETLINEPQYRYAASVMESKLTTERFEVIVPRQAANLSALNESQMGIAGADQDIAYSLALSIGSDVYMTFSFYFEQTGRRRVCFVSISAYETATARLLGTETGTSRHDGESAAIEEAITVAINKLVPKINDYWRNDAQFGIQFKIVFTISNNMPYDDLWDMQQLIFEIIEDMSARHRENLATQAILDYLIWCDPAKFANSRTVFNELRTKLNASRFGTRLHLTNINRKMILLRIE